MLLVEAPTIDTNQVLAFYSAEYESFLQGTLALNCKNCSVKFYLNQSALRQMHDQQDWRGLAQHGIKTDYDYDLAYYYLAVAANGLGLVDTAKIYFRKAKQLSENVVTSCVTAKIITCNDIALAVAVDEALK